MYTGGVSSYFLILLVVSFFQQHPRGPDTAAQPNANLGVLLVEFLEHYGVNFNYARTGIRIREKARLVEKEELMAEIHASLLEREAERRARLPRHHHNGSPAGLPPPEPVTSTICIEDPIDPANDVGRPSYGALGVLHAFKKAHHDLHQRLVDPRQSFHENSRYFSV